MNVGGLDNSSSTPPGHSSGQRQQCRSGSAATTCVGVGGGGSGVSREQRRELYSVEHMDTALVSDGSVDSRSAAHYVCECRWTRRWCQSTAVERAAVGGASSPTAVSTVDRPPPRVWVSVDSTVVSVDGSGESCSRWSTWTQFSSPSTVWILDRLSPRVLESVELVVVSDVI